MSVLLDMTLGYLQGEVWHFINYLLVYAILLALLWFFRRTLLEKHPYRRLCLWLSLPFLALIPLCCCV